MAKRKHDPFFTHLWDELVNVKLLPNETIARWAELPGKLQSQFVDAAQRAMNSALGAPAKARRARKAAKKKAPKAKTKTKTKAKGRPKVTAKTAKS